MRIISLRAAIPFILVLAFLPACFGSELPPLSAGWRGAAYHGLLAELRPRNPNKMKFLFLGDPAPCTLGQMRGYGGFVHMRKKGALWFQGNATYFYLVDANGNLCTLRRLDSLNEDSVSPQMVTVEMVEKQVWVDPPTYTTTIPDGNGGWDTIELPSGVGYYATEIERRVDPILAPGQGERLTTFRKAKFTPLPLCQ